MEGVLRYPVVVHHDVVHHIATGTPWAVSLEGLGGGDECTVGVLTTTQDGDADAAPFGSYRLQEDIRLDRRLDIGVRLYIAREPLLAPRSPVTQVGAWVRAQSGISVLNSLGILTSIEVEACSEGVSSLSSEVVLRLTVVR